MDFYAILDQVIALLRQRQRVTYRALQRQFGIDDAYLVVNLTDHPLPASAVRQSCT